MKHTNFEHLITEMNKCQTAEEAFAFAEDMISSYTAGKQEEHTKALNAIKAKFYQGMDSPAKRERWAFNKTMVFMGNVCQEIKVA